MQIEEVLERLKLDIGTPLYCGDLTIVLIEDLQAVLNYIDIIQKEFDRLEGIEDNTAMLKFELDKKDKQLQEKQNIINKLSKEC